MNNCYSISFKLWEIRSQKQMCWCMGKKQVEFYLGNPYQRDFWQIWNQEGKVYGIGVVTFRQWLLLDPLNISSKSILTLALRSHKSSKAFFFLISFFLIFRAAPLAYGSSQVRGWTGAAAASLSHSHSNLGSESHLNPMPQPQQCQIQVLSATCTTAHRNTGSLTHWWRPGIKPASS